MPVCFQLAEAARAAADIGVLQVHILDRFRCGIATFVIVSTAASIAAAQKPSDELLPETTKGYISIPSGEALETQFNKTQLGELTRDAQMKPFADDLKAQIRQRMAADSTIGVLWDNLRGVPTGEVAMATFKPTATTAGTALIAVVKGNEEQAKTALDKVDANLRLKRAKLNRVKIGEIMMNVYDIPAPPAGGKPETAVFFIHDGQLIGVDHRAEAEAIARRMAGQANDSLSSWVVYQKVRARIDQDAGDLTPEVKWFIEPFGYVEAMRIIGPQEEKRGKDMLKTLKNQGFTAIQGFGGNVNFAVEGGRDILHRTYIYAPAVERAADDDNKDKYDLAARMMKFPNNPMHDPPNWVPRDLATYTSGYVDLANAFEASSTLVNELADAEVFEDVIDGLKNDPNGPRIDVREELLAHLDNRLVMITDNIVPITPESERVLIGAKVKDTAAVREGVRKLMANDASVRRREYNGHIIWEVVEGEADLPEVNVEGFGFDPLENTAEEEQQQAPKMFPHATVTVIDGWVLLGSHMDVMHRILDTVDNNAPTLAAAVDYQLVRAEAQKLGEGNNSCQTFSRTDEEYRGTYELLKSGRMPKSQSLLGKALNNVFSTDEKPGEERKQRLDATKLPPYEVTRRYLGPGGVWVVSEDEGWLVTGILLPKQLPVANLKLGKG
ncbi:MAG: hypothetical protein WD030_06070, partial [Pirellulales bacterium]